MMVDLPHIIIPFMTAFLKVAAAALAIGMLPALWIIARQRYYGLLWRWGIVTILLIAATLYGLPMAHVAWKKYARKNFKPVAMYMGYFVSVLFAPMLLPEPLRLARRRLERPQERARRVRHKRRKDGFPRDLNIR